MLLTLTTTHRPATDLGYLLVKHPDRVHRFDLPYGTATVVYPEATEQRCTAALLLEAGPRQWDGNRYVNDRPYAASSLLSAALNRVFRTAARGGSKDRPELAATPIPLEIRVPSLSCKGGVELAERLFAPLGWTVSGQAIPLDPEFPQWGESRYVDLTLEGVLTLADALNHLYVLMSVLDDAKHYWVAPDEVDKLLSKGSGWLDNHPERALIVRRFLAHRRALTKQVLDEEESAAEKPRPLNAVRRAAVLEVLAGTGASRVLDLGCGGGALLGELMRNPRYTEIVGADVSASSLEQAERRLRLDRLPDRQRSRIKLIQSALTYSDDRLVGYDAAILMEVIEHVDESRLTALSDAVFGHAAPAHVIVTTPNVEYNVRYELLPHGQFRHGDHRFEWTRAQFAAWAAAVGQEHGYDVAIRGVGEEDPEVGMPTQLALFSKKVTK